MRRVTTELYEQMWKAYQEKQSVRHVSAVCKVHEATAKKYVEKGAPEVGWKALRDRYQNQTVAADKVIAKKLAYTLADSQDDTLKLTRRMKLLAMQAMVAMQGAGVKNPERWVDIAWKIETAVLGGSHMNVAVKGGMAAALAEANDPCVGMDEDEQIEFLELAVGVFRAAQTGIPSGEEGLASHAVH